ncbi:MAG: ankyrin repeat domain-containing protein [Opitutaceae bacterium]|nr:ankyrin repeat domain-containing protein [Opitutaceae bacterium]
MHPTPRRQFLGTTALGALALSGSSLLLAQAKPELPSASPGAPKTPPPPKPPALPADKVQSVVGESHRNLEAVRTLVEATPLLANACWDWGGGDFETPLQAAAHTGQREIALYLLSKQARFDVYAAAMLGDLDRVKAWLGDDPVGLAAVPGPHGFTLLHCAKRGGDRAKSVYEFLVKAGVPEVFQRPLPFVWPAGTAPS